MRFSVAGWVENRLSMRWPESGLMMNMCAVAGLRSASSFGMTCAALEIFTSAEGRIVVPLYPNWDAGTQRLYLERYGIRDLVVGPGFASRPADWGDIVDRTLELILADAPGTGPGAASAPVHGDAAAFRDVFPETLPPDRACAWIFTSGTSGSLAKCTEITLGNLDAAIENLTATVGEAAPDTRRALDERGRLRRPAGFPT